MFKRPSAPTATTQSALIVQADSKEAQVLVQFFSKRGDTVWLAATAPEAWPLLKQNAPHLLILDLHLPDNQCVDLLREARRMFPLMRVVITNKYPDLRNEMKVKELGAAVFLRQPFERVWIEKALARLAEPPRTLPSGALKTPPRPTVKYPLSVKISVPYVALAVVIAIVAALLVNRYLFESFRARFDAELQAAGLTVQNNMVVEENRLLQVLRAIANTEGMVAATQAGDATRLRALAFPTAFNAEIKLLAIQNATGQNVFTARHNATERRYEFLAGDTTFAQWEIARQIMRGEMDVEGDKYAARETYHDQDYFLIAGPIRQDDNTVVGSVIIGLTLPDMLTRLSTAQQVARLALYDAQGAPLAAWPAAANLTPLTPETAQTIRVRQHQASFQLDYAVAGINYTEVLGPWEARNGADLGVLGVALVQNDLTRNNMWAQWQLYGAIAVIMACMAVLGYVIASRFTVSLREISAAAAQVADGNFELRVDTRGDDEVAVLAHSFNYMVSELQEGSIYRDLLGRAVSPEVREELRRAFASNDLRLDGQAMVATVMLTDISGFTTLSEKQAPTTILAWLNEYFNELVPLVTTHGGVVDKFEGDALLVFFGILPQPLTAGASAYAACRAAVAMQAAIHDLNTRRAERGHPPMLTGIGLNTGEVTAGSLGTADRLNYTIIGDVVNTTQRLESFTRTIEGCGIVISQETYTALGERRAEFDIVSLGPQRFKGKTEAVAVYHLRNHTLEPGIRAA